MYIAICEYELCLRTTNILISVKKIAKTVMYTNYLFTICLYVKIEINTNLEVCMLVKSEISFVKKVYDIEILVLSNIYVSLFFIKSRLYQNSKSAKTLINYGNCVNMCHHYCIYNSYTNTKYLCRNKSLSLKVMVQVKYSNL